MPPRLRKLISLTVLLPGLLAYALGAMLLADFVPKFWLFKLCYFVIAGVGWAAPALLLLRWAEDRKTSSETER